MTATERLQRILVADLEGEAPAFELQVAGVAPDAKATVTVLDYTHDLEKIPVTLKDGVLETEKFDEHSVAGLIEFE